VQITYTPKITPEKLLNAISDLPLTHKNCLFATSICDTAFLKGVIMNKMLRRIFWM
jgi:hypothetical protein